MQIVECFVICCQGLEVEVQRLIARHRAELAATLDKAAEQSKATAEAARAENEAAMRALKQKLKQVPNTKGHAACVAAKNASHCAGASCIAEHGHFTALLSNLACSCLTLSTSTFE